MKKIYLLILSVFIGLNLFSQLVNYEVEIIAVERTNYSDCGGCGTPDPTWMIGLTDNTSGTVSSVGIHVPSNGTIYTPVNYALTNRVNTNATNFVLRLDAWEDNCNSDVFNFNTYNFFTCFPSVFGDANRCTNNNVASVNFRTFAPCTWHDGTTNWCGDYRYTYRFRWSFNQAPVIATQPTPADNNLCIGTPITFTASTTTDPNGWATGSNYQWQVSTSTACGSGVSWSDVGGANSASFTPPQTPGTRLYRVLVTANCGSNFVSNTTASNCVRVTYNPFGITGDTPPDIQSGICGSIVLPGSSHPLSALVPPAVGAANGVTFQWTATGGTFTQNTGPNTVWNAPATAGNYIITLTYVDACSQADAYSTCVVDVGSPNCDFAYVATTGTDDVFAGGPDNPYRTLTYALSQLAGRKYIRMAGGTYNESSVIELEDDLVIEGGYQYSAGIWKKITTQTTNLVLSGFQNASVTGDNNAEHRVGIYGNDDDRFTLQDLTIQTTNITGTTSTNRGRSNYAILLINGCDDYNIVRCNISSGTASRGANGTTPGNGGGGAGATTGGAGGAGANGNGNPGGGSSGANGTSAPYTATTHPPYVYPAGADGTFGLGGGGTDNCPGGSGCFDGGCDGANGAVGNPGANGRSWQVGDFAPNPLANSIYYIPTGQAGSGQNGGGGGKGAGGNGSRGGRRVCVNCDGKTGGTGGNGGTGGRGGSGGYGSGGSFGIYTHNSNTGSNITNVTINIPSTEAAGGTGANGSNGIGGSGGGSGECNSCVTTPRCSGNGGRGGNGGNGGRGRDGSDGQNAHLVVNGVASNPSTSIPNFPIVSVEYNNAKACIYSEINLTKDGPNAWSLPLNYVNDLSDAPAPLTATSFSNGANEVSVYSTTPGQVVNMQVGGAVFSGYLHIADDVRQLPTLTVSSQNMNCIGSTVTLSASTWGTEVEYDWRIYQGTDVDNPSLSPSTLASPTYNLTGLPPGLYTVRYKVREVCCGWSIPVYDTIRIIDEPIIYLVQGGGGYCPGSNGSVVTLSGSQAGVTYVLYANGAPVDTVIGTGAPFGFDPQTLPGNYTVNAESIAGCDNNMQGNVNIFVHPQPNDQNVVADAYVCAQGSHTNTQISLDDSEIGVNYQLVLNDTVPLGVPVSGTGFSVSFGNQSVAGQYTVLATNNSTSCTRWLSDTINVVLLPGPTPYALDGGGSFCAGTAGANIELSNSEDQVDYQLIWNHTVPIGTAQSGSAGNTVDFGVHNLTGYYTVVATDDVGCQSIMSDTLLINELTAPQITSVIVDELDCYGDSSASITVTGNSYNGGLNYVLNTDTNTTGLFDSLSAGNYLVSIFDDSLCEASYPITPIQIQEPAELNIALESLNNVNCFGKNEGSIGVNVTGGTPTYTYSWTSSNAGFSSANEDISGLSGGDYYLTVTDNKGCSVSDTFTITEPSVALSASISTVDVLCYGNASGQATVNVTGGTAPYTYLWHNNDTAQTVSNVEAGAVSVTVTDANGCTTYVRDTISGPTTDLAITLIRISHVTCFGGNNGEIITSVTGGTAPYTIAWTPSGGNAETASNLTADTYTITVTDANGCIKTASYTINQPQQLVSNISPTQPGCPGEETGIASVGVNGGTLPYSYEWNTTPLQYGMVANQLSGDRWYVVTITDHNGCVLLDSVYLTNPDTMTVSVEPGNSTCISGRDGYASIVVDGGNAPYSYELNGNYQTDSFYNNLGAGSYFVSVEDNRGCVASTQFQISSNTSVQVNLFGSTASVINEDEEIIIVNGEQVDFDAVLSNTTDSTTIINYIWSPIDFNYDNCDYDTLCPNPSANITQTTQVIVEVIEFINGVGCSTFDTLDVTVRTDFPVFFPNAFSPNADCLNDYFEMNVAGAKNLDVKVFNRWGEMVFANATQTNGPADPNTLDCSNPRSAWDGTYKGQPVPIGTYVYQVEVSYFDDRTETFSGTITVLR